MLTAVMAMCPMFNCCQETQYPSMTTDHQWRCLIVIRSTTPTSLNQHPSNHIISNIQCMIRHSDNSQHSILQPGASRQCTLVNFNVVRPNKDLCFIPHHNPIQLHHCIQNEQMTASWAHEQYNPLKWRDNDNVIYSSSLRYSGSLA